MFRASEMPAIDSVGTDGLLRTGSHVGEIVIARTHWSKELYDREFELTDSWVRSVKRAILAQISKRLIGPAAIRPLRASPVQIGTIWKGFEQSIELTLGK